MWGRQWGQSVALEPFNGTRTSGKSHAIRIFGINLSPRTSAARLDCSPTPFDPLIINCVQITDPVISFNITSMGKT